MGGIVWAFTHCPLETLAGNPHATLAAENRRFLHIHIVARRKTDAAWPNPVWAGVDRCDMPQMNYGAM